MHIQADEEDEAGKRVHGGPDGRILMDRFLRWGFSLDSFWVTQYVDFDGVCFSLLGGLGRESHHLWLGTAHAAQPTLTPQSRHQLHFHRIESRFRSVRRNLRLASGAPAIHT